MIEARLIWEVITILIVLKLLHTRTCFYLDKRQDNYLAKGGDILTTITIFIITMMILGHLGTFAGLGRFIRSLLN